MSMLWTAEELVAAMGGRPVGQLPDGVNGISIDSRSIAPMDAFFAIKGDRFDGHEFVGKAAANGAGVVVVAENKLPALGAQTVPMLVVDDVLKALERLGLAARARSNAKIVAVTGSVGKTTTKAMLKTALGASGAVHASVASFNNHWGVPVTLARMPRDVDFGVFEIGMNHADEIRPLVQMVRPHVAIVTTIAPVHIGNFSGIEAIADAKSEIFEGVEAGGHVLINTDIDQYKQLYNRAEALGISNIHGFGKHKRSIYRLLKWHLHDACSCMTMRVGSDDIALKVGAPGLHVVENAVAVMATVSLCGGDLTKAAQALGEMTAEKGRGARHRLNQGDGGFTLIDESYNANPASMAAALTLLADSQVEGKGRRIAVLGDMLELGERARELHLGLSATIKKSNVDKLYLVGSEMASLRDEMQGDLSIAYFDNADDAAKALKRAIWPGDVIMVKSSLGIGFGRIITALLDKFPGMAESEPAEWRDRGEGRQC